MPDSLTVRERDADGEIESLKARLRQAEWDRAHYRDLYLLACGVTVVQLAPLSAVRQTREEGA